MAKAGGGGGSGGGGAILRHAVGITTNAYVALFTALGLNGLIGIGTIKNNSASAASGSLLVPPAGGLAPGTTFTLNDGVNPATVFEFTMGGGPGPGHVAVDLTGLVTADDVRDKIILVISTTPALLIVASSGGTGLVNLVNSSTGVVGNHAITTTAAITVSGMAGGTAANALNIKETVIDAFGITSFLVTTVNPGDTYLLDLQGNFPAAVCPYVSYLVEVEDAVGGSHAAFEVYLTTVESTGSSGTIAFPPSTYVFVSPDVLTTTDNALIPWIPGAGRTISQLLAVVKTAPTGQAIIIEYFIGDLATGVVGASLGTVTIPIGAFTATTGIAPIVIGNSSFVAMTINQVGNVIAGSNLTAIAR
jgi:hypothetical protein